MKTTTRIAAFAAAVVFTGCSTTKETVKKEEPVKKETQAVQKTRTSQDTFADGVAAFDAGKLDEAQAAFEGFAAREPQLVSGHFNSGVVAERQGRVADAQKFY
jgi:PBP1b-binding outer membrane lipoprotein LpoB